MKAKIQKWGNSLAIRIPNSIGKELKVSYGSEVEIMTKNNQIIIEIVNTDELLEGLIDEIRRSGLSRNSISDLANEFRAIFESYQLDSANLPVILFKTSGETFENVIKYKKHAFVHPPKNWSRGSLVLISKNKNACLPGEKQISYTANIKDIRVPSAGEIETYWEGNEGRWNYLVELENVRKLSNPFNLEDILGDKAAVYAPVVSFKTVEKNHLDRILKAL